MAPRGRQPFIPITHVMRSRFPDLDDYAQLIAEHRVLVDGRIATNPNGRVRHDASIRLLPPTSLRGDHKLSTALEALGLDIAGQVVVDVGAAAGGFTTALLRAGARRVYAVDTGYGQLLGSLRLDHRVVNLERTNVAALDVKVVPDTVDLVTMDLSYTKIATHCKAITLPATTGRHGALEAFIVATRATPMS
jgi:23S rRNA (cytidine1920-2'-O)/16S rRNA (cytidine1409-2'-O)-methyltransferase